jgi:hypothetical protein
MSDYTRYTQKWQGYFIEDIDCPLCLHWQGRKNGCKHERCLYESEKADALANGRIKRKRGSMSWHG